MRVRASFRFLPTVVVLRIIRSAWPAWAACRAGAPSSRSGRHASLPLLPCVSRSSLASRAMAPPWVLVDRYELALFARPLRTAIWIYAVYSVVRDARHGLRWYRRDELAHSLLAAVLGLGARTRRSPADSFEGWLALPHSAIRTARRVVGQGQWLPH